MTTLVLLAHADPSVRTLYEAAMAPLGGRVEIRPFVSHHPGMSSAYDALAKEHSHGGRILPSLLATYAPGVSFDRLVLAWWSGGYALGRAILSIPTDAEAVDGVAALDGMHTGLVAGQADPVGLRAFADYAGAARAGRKVFHVGHTDVETAPAYASTTACARKLVELVGPPAAGFRVDAFNLEPGSRAAAEHVHALRTWGPEYVAGVVAAVTPGADAPSAPVAASVPLGVRALQAALSRLTVREATGRNDGDAIKAFFAGATRRGPDGVERLTGWTPGWEWCAAFASWSCWSVLRAGDVAPHGWRIAVHELVTDARARGTWREAGYCPSPGDLAILPRGGEDPRHGGKGHVGVVEIVTPDGVSCIDGNSTNQGVQRVKRSRADVVGWIARGGEVERPGPLALALAALGRFRAVTEDVARAALAEDA